MISAEKTKSSLRNLGKFMAALILILACSQVSPGRATALSSGLVIYQLQTGGSSATQEFISVMNSGNEPKDVTDFCIEYVTASGASRTELACLDSPDSSTQLMLGPKNALTFASTEFKTANSQINIDKVFSSGISGTSGHIRLLDSRGDYLDTLGWGSATQPEGTPATAHPTGKALQRVIGPGTDFIQDNDNNSADFSAVTPAYVNGGNIYEEISEVSPDQKIILITELLPDPEGADYGKEFIEFYNPNDVPVNLNDYKLVIATSSEKSYLLPNIVIQPNSYAMVSDTDVGFVLPNTSAEIKLISLAGITVSSTAKYEELGENVSWALSENTWHLTYVPTPGEANNIVSAKPCPLGQERSEATGFCRNIQSADNDGGLSACLPGRERNTDTGRCRLIAATAETRAACKVNQTRNPETGRCRNVQSSEQKACPEGQERNSETGRCRKIPGGGKPLAEVKDIAAPLVKGNAKWWIAGASAAGSVGYGAYEWRGDMRKWLVKFKDKLSGGTDN